MVIFFCADCERVGAALAPLSVQQICKNSIFFLQMQDTFGKKKVFSLPSRACGTPGRCGQTEGASEHQ